MGAHCVLSLGPSTGLSPKSAERESGPQCQQEPYWVPLSSARLVCPRRSSEWEGCERVTMDTVWAGSQTQTPGCGLVSIASGPREGPSESSPGRPLQETSPAPGTAVGINPAPRLLAPRSRALPRSRLPATHDRPVGGSHVCSASQRRTGQARELPDAHHCKLPPPAQSSGLMPGGRGGKERGCRIPAALGKNVDWPVTVYSWR